MDGPCGERGEAPGGAVPSRAVPSPFGRYMLMAGFEDLEFSVSGYTWMIANCVATTSYVLYMRHAMASVELSRWAMIFYNNTI